MKEFVFDDEVEFSRQTDLWQSLDEKNPEVMTLEKLASGLMRSAN